MDLLVDAARSIQGLPDLQPSGVSNRLLLSIAVPRALIIAAIVPVLRDRSQCDFNLEFKFAHGPLVEYRLLSALQPQNSIRPLQGNPATARLGPGTASERSAWSQLASELVRLPRITTFPLWCLARRHCMCSMSLVTEAEPRDSDRIVRALSAHSHALRACRRPSRQFETVCYLHAGACNTYSFTMSSQACVHPMG
ncbi:hypothetical protein V8C44DRAFT_65962 [Trichoderma aethiopicum]